MASGVTEALRSQLDESDIRRNSTLQSLSAIDPHLQRVADEADRIETIVDLGCGTGAFAAALGDVLDADLVYGVEVDTDDRERALDRGLTVYDLDLETEPLPFEDSSVDLVVSFGLLEHLKWYDHVLSESHRVLRQDGALWLSVPNLGSYVNRLALLLGYQPRNVELSERHAVGILPAYPHSKPIGHVHAPTRRALLELVSNAGFEPVSSIGLAPYQDRLAVRVLDRLLGWHPSLARRIAVLAQRRSTDQDTTSVTNG